MDNNPTDLLNRITHHPEVLGGIACIRGLRVSVSNVLCLLASDRSPEEILAAYPYLERDDIRAALVFASWQGREGDFPWKTW